MGLRELWAIAGFVEPGESLGEAVERDLEEEVGIRVKNIKYFGSQPWPFPHSLMVGFTAEWARGEIRPDGKEIEDARWFTPDFSYHKIYLPKRQQKNKSKRLFIILVIWVELP